MRGAGFTRIVLFVASMVLAAAPHAFAADEGPLGLARMLYNQRQFDAAIAAAEEALQTPEWVDSANLIAARAYLERFRESAAPADLASARERLRDVEPQQFSGVERTEYLIGLGQALFFEGSPGGAADLFVSVLDAVSSLTPQARERTLDWWASAVDADAQTRSGIERQSMYRQVSERMNAELSRNPVSAVAAYWLSAAARGAGDLQSAWDAALAAWVRAPLTADYGATLRGDLDRLVQRAIVPERARIASQPPELLLAEWEAFKQKWN